MEQRDCCGKCEVLLMAPLGPGRPTWLPGGALQSNRGTHMQRSQDGGSYHKELPRGTALPLPSGSQPKSAPNREKQNLSFAMPHV